MQELLHQSPEWESDWGIGTAKSPSLLTRTSPALHVSVSLCLCHCSPSPAPALPPFFFCFFFLLRSRSVVYISALSCSTDTRLGTPPVLFHMFADGLFSIISKLMWRKGVNYLSAALHLRLMLCLSSEGCYSSSLTTRQIFITSHCI